MNKIIQKEKERQEEYIENLNIGKGDIIGEGAAMVEIATHKQSLINLKEYMEEIIPEIINNEVIVKDEYDMGDGEDFYKLSNGLKEDIKELTKMIDKYE